MGARNRLPPDQGTMGFRENRMAVRFSYEWRDDSDHWFRSYGNELWEFADSGLMRRRIASINDLRIKPRSGYFIGRLAGGPTITRD